MPSEIAKQIVDRIFGDEKSKAVDLTNDALALQPMMLFKHANLNLQKPWVSI